MAILRWHRGALRSVPGRGSRSPSLLRRLPARLFFLLASSAARYSSATAPKHTCRVRRKSRERTASESACNISHSFAVCYFAQSWDCSVAFLGGREATFTLLPHQLQSLSAFTRGTSLPPITSKFSSTSLVL